LSTPVQKESNFKIGGTKLDALCAIRVSLGTGTGKFPSKFREGLERCSLINKMSWAV
jgi:hypothetical protein